MPTVPNVRQMLGMEPDQAPTPEHLLMTAADMQARGQLNDSETFSKPGANLRLPFRHGPRPTRPQGKRR